MASRVPTIGTSTYEVLKEATPEAVVIHCGDPRFQAAFREFIEGRLGLKPGQYIPFVVPGGPGSLGRPDTLPKAYKFMKEGLELYREHFKSIKRIIIVNHEGCAWYKDLSGTLGRLIPFHTHLPLEDMTLISQVFARLLNHLGFRIEKYYAKFADDGHTKVVIEPAQ
jgi:hypothetical protein